MIKKRGGGAPIGNKNARGPHDKGAASGLIGGAFGPGGSLYAGIYSGGVKTERGIKSSRRNATGVGMLAGGAIGVGVAAATATGVGPAVLGGMTAGGLVNNATHRLGARIGRSLSQKEQPKTVRKGIQSLYQKVRGK